MRRVTLMVAAMGVMVALFAGVAYAATIDGTSQGDILLDSNLNDTIFGRGGGDAIRADAFGPEGILLFGDPGAPCCGPDTDVARGNAGPDFIVVTDGDNRDTAIGGDGNDTCFGDTLAELNCENETVGPPMFGAGAAVSQLGPPVSQ
jgi:Ca2+-binding RTX toxin-like protein